MAKAIRQINKSSPNPEEVQKESLANLLQAISANQDALMMTLDIIKGLHEMGVLEAAKSMLEQSEDIGAIAMKQANQPGVHNIIKNGMAAIQFAGSIHPEQLQAVLNGLNLGFERMLDVVQTGEQKGLFKLASSLREKEVLVSLTTLTEFLHGMGEAFKQENNKVHE
ncbi:DUF1641 domain-containing protein [Robertmurraya sp. DFI.2.37]|uniref:DUF1641 domain-containing protein n=1 Tax=Robertmurraya sp. DFI.2.37 TaxID=3031819 RepID=UPI001246E802|nr:DUF1641 domain-containing protein [Robertmurraya sp. DFI.2.37]MDF1507057.1 DUF1641 domain-containing protein [Robertmurraya sp. DFI.2.37]